MAIEYIEVFDATNRKPIGIIDTAKSIIWHAVYFGVGDFEIYCQATKKHIELLKKGNIVTKNDTDDFGFIENINVTFTLLDGYMIVASGRFLKGILDRRLIYNLNGKTNTPTVISGNVERAAYILVNSNCIACSWDTRRNFPDFMFAPYKNFPQVILDENGNPASKQVSYQNLLEYTDELLHEYGLASRIFLNKSSQNYNYEVYTGVDRSVENQEGNDPVIISIEYDNLNSSNYIYNEKPLKNVALIGGQGQGLERFYSLLTDGQKGLERREVFVDASSINKKYKDAQQQEQEYTDAEYTELLNQQGQQALLDKIIEEKFDGDINVNFGRWILNRDYFIGDIITVQDNMLGIYLNERIVETTEVQDESGYKVSVVFGDPIEIVPIILGDMLSTEANEVLLTENGKILLTERGE